MNKLAKRSTNQLDIAHGGAMLKHTPAEDVKEMLAGYLLKCIKLNMEPFPEPEALGMIAAELYDLLAKTWPGVRPNQIWLTLKYGMAKGGQYRIRINYPTVANWLMYHKQTGDGRSELEKAVSPSLNTQAEDVLSGLKEYRKKVASGEYKPRGRE